MMTLEALPPRREWQELEHQNREEPKRALFADPRLGKTRSVVDAWVETRPKRGVVTCPIKVGPFWAEQLRAVGFRVVEGYAHTTAWTRLNLPDEGIVVVNDDKMHTLVDAFLRWAPDALAIDESHRLKSPTSQRGKAMRKLAKVTPWVRILTGTPAPNHYGDLWGQLACICPQDVGNWAQFSDKYLTIDRYFHNRIIGFNKETLPELQAILLRYATIVRREDVFGPDTYQRVTRELDLPSEAREVYDRLATEWVLDDLDVEAVTLLTRLIRLQQLASGFIKDTLGNNREIHTVKLDAVEADLDEIIAAREKAVIFHRFTWEAERYEALARKMCPTVVTVNGSVSAAQADQAIRTFRNAAGAAIAVVQTQAGGTGVDFATATHALFVSDGFSFADRKQAEDRIYSPGKCRVITTYTMRDTIDQFVADTLSLKDDVAQAVRHADRRTMAYGIRRRK